MKKLTALVLLFILLLCLFGCGKEAATIGIIGGADGPTAVFVTSGTNDLSIGSLIGMIAVTIGIMLMIRRYRKQK